MLPNVQTGRPKFHLVLHSTVVLAMLALPAAIGAQPIVDETFDASLNGWSFYADAASLTWDAAGGNPGGAARGQDQGTGGWWGFVAPAEFLGDHSCKYGGSLEWQTKTNGVNTAGNSQPDVTIEGAGLILVYDTPNPVVNVWANRSVVLSATAGWKKTTLSGVAPTESEFRSVLANITALKFRAEFTSASGGDIGFIDNVALRSLTLVSPTSIVVCPTGIATFSVLVTSPNPFAYQWRKDGTPIDSTAQGNPTAATATLELSNVSSNDVASYDCVITNSCGSVTSSPATLSLAVKCSQADIVGAKGGPIVCGDSAVDGSDYIAFINSFSTGDPAIDPLADVAGAGPNGDEPDGTIDGSDYIAFINAFAAGC